MKDWYVEIPKAELHRHLECTVRLDTIAETARRHNLPLPHKNWQELKKRVQIPEPLKGLQSVIDVFLATQSIFVAPEVLERVAFEAVEDAWFDGIRLVEFRYAPSFTVEGHELTFEDAFDAFQRGIRRAQAKYPLAVGLIAIAVRGHGLKKAEEVWMHARKHRGDFVGFDLADTEVGFDFSQWTKLFSEIRASGMPITIHAGEEKGLAPNVLTAIRDFGARRIGHGVQIAYEPEILAQVKASGVPLELCPTSNWLTHAVDRLEEHPIHKIFRSGVPVSINSDDPGVFAIRLSGEYRLCGEKLGFKREELQRVVARAVQDSFIDADQKKFYAKKYFSF